MSIADNVRVDKRLWDKLRAKAKRLDKMHVKIGVLASKGGAAAHGPDQISLIELAAIHEFGSPAAHIPERSFIRATFNIRRVNALRDMVARLAKAIITNDLAPERALAMLGAWGAAEVKNTITEIDIPPPLADSTVQAKGSSKPLVDTGLLKNSISYEVVTNEGEP